MNKLNGLSKNATEILITALTNDLKRRDESQGYVDPTSLEDIEYLLSQLETILKGFEL